MKKILLSGLMVLSAVTAFAQNRMSGETARFGVKAGVNLANLSKGDFDGDYKNNVGYNVTVFGDFGVAKNFFIQPGVSLQSKGAKVSEFKISNVTTSGKINLMALEVPVNAVLRIPTGPTGAFQINAGPYVGFNLSGKYKIDAVDNTNGNTTTLADQDIKFGDGSAWKTTDFGVNMGVAYRFEPGVTVGVNYGLGLSDVNTYGSQNRVLGFTVGYSF